MRAVLCDGPDCLDRTTASESLTQEKTRDNRLAGRAGKGRSDMHNTLLEQTRQVSQIDCIDSDYLRLPYCWMVELGPACQSLAAIVQLMDGKSKQFFCSAKKIAECACIPVGTLRKHLKALESKGVIENLGRKRRRTPTYQVKDNWLSPPTDRFGALPRWAAKMLPTWSERAVYSYYVSARHLAEHLRARDEGEIEDEDIMQLSVRKLAKKLSLDVTSTNDALLRLSRSADGEPLLLRNISGGFAAPQEVFLNEEFMIDCL